MREKDNSALLQICCVLIILKKTHSFFITILQNEDMAKWWTEQTQNETKASQSRNVSCLLGCSFSPKIWFHSVLIAQSWTLLKTSKYLNQVSTTFLDKDQETSSAFHHGAVQCFTGLWVLYWWVPALHKQMICSPDVHLLRINEGISSSFSACQYKGHQITQNSYLQVQYYHLNWTQVQPTNPFHLVYPFPTSCNNSSTCGYHSYRTCTRAQLCAETVVYL